MSQYRIKDIISNLRQAGIKATQTGMAEAADAPQSYISRIVNNQTKAVDPSILFAIANYLAEVSNQKFTIASLFYEEGSIPQSANPETPSDPSSQDDEVLRAIEHLENCMDKGFAEVNRQIADLRDSNSKQGRRTARAAT